MRAGRPRQFDPPVALGRATELFWSRGYEGTSLQGLLATTGLSRSSLYQTFGDKHRLFSRCLEYYREKTAAAMWQRLEEAPSGRAFVELMLRRAVDERDAEGGPRGCLVLNTATEFGHRDPDVTHQVQLALSAFRAVFEEAVRRGQADGSIRSARDPHRLAAYIVAGMGGLRTLVKADEDRNHVQDALDVLLLALDRD
ncbi:TetR/AcrR family transcriptional regulator [Aquisalimonas asiatica]|uniref:Transcriptional regulator, TetR family n=1 Tax=Aquisalimonas asiatica TaxID=406100 RepID=A0A1H8RQR6_9GAMM|nr:TetR/AcrR family transcriptional regulator [Aquisalimonas asiatica]SEO68676.1 transcriptional regulator, TetR family [Aquisalimonas asiatica]